MPGIHRSAQWAARRCGRLASQLGRARFAHGCSNLRKHRWPSAPWALRSDPRLRRRLAQVTMLRIGVVLRPLIPRAAQATEEATPSDDDNGRRGSKTLRGSRVGIRRGAPARRGDLGAQPAFRTVRRRQPTREGIRSLGFPLPGREPRRRAPGAPERSQFPDKRSRRRN